MIKFIKLFAYLAIIGGIAKFQQNGEINDYQNTTPSIKEQTSTQNSSIMAITNVSYRNPLVFQTLIISKETDSASDSLAMKFNH
ncbi:hypothetical protein [Alkalitalea saponilacus]|uniref:Uncharacterized protein n=1 Tax=Alkalitalea saponilacus TaxID=889453 RepID=A0A1T5HL71_9BACT|nr:hypothetical protein [Alkalitalea saponilacus]ASB47794.1 hypothetical protein CDL62_00825 [Alkalitalea saponilacus]SKC21290.1 hypothetical protein SAMN03080601_02400 [Alkalitalea saponilacus]